MPVTCPQCSSEAIDLVERVGDHARKLRCEACGHEWLRHSQAVPPSDRAARDDATRRKAAQTRRPRAPDPRRP